MYDQETEKCPKCKKMMVNLDTDCRLVDKWKCPYCGYEESKSPFDSELEQHYVTR